MTLRSNCRLKASGLIVAGLLCLWPLVAAGADAAAEKGKWVRLAPKTPGAPDATDVRKVLPTGNPTAVRGGLAVNRITGELFVTACYYGVWKSTDRGRTFNRIDNGKIHDGSPFSPYALQIDPADGKGIAAFNANVNINIQAACGFSTDGGAAWQLFGPVNTVYHPNPNFLLFDCLCAIDWKSLAVLVHNGDQLYFSSDGGKSWQMLSKTTQYGGFTGLGVFDAKVLVVSKSNIERSEDGGKTWTAVSDLVGVGPVQFFKGTAYWLSNKGDIITSKDAGKTWTPLAASPAKATRGPYFGNDEKHLVVLGADGFSETTDGGQTWKLAAPNAPTYADVVPSGYTIARVDTSTAGFDPVNNVFYYLPPDGYLEDIWKFER